MRHVRTPRAKKVLRLRFRRPQNLRRVAIRSGLAVVGVLLLVQLIYPTVWALPFDTVDGQRVGLQPKDAIRDSLTDKYQQSRVDILLGQRATKAYASPTVKQLGLGTSSDNQIAALDYPLWLRLVPTSLLWGHFVTASPAVTVTDNKSVGKYVDAKLMSTCEAKPVNATLEVRDAKLAVVADKSGGKCQRDEVVKGVSSVVPRLAETPTVRTPLTEIPAKYTANEAKTYRDELAKRIGDKIELKVGDQVVAIPAKEFLPWLDFTASDDGVTTMVSAERASKFLSEHIAPKVAVAPGTSHVTTRDFTEISRTNGAAGAELNVPATTDSLNKFLARTIDQAQATTRPIPAKVVFTRTYSSSDAGLNALLENYAKDHPGEWGISMAEIGSKGRRANYNGDKQFVTASTYKLFVAYSVLRRVEAGTFNWDAEAGCFNKMISHSDNPCAEGFQTKIGGGSITNGAKPLTSEAQALGLKNTTFMKAGGPYTTTNDLVTFLGSLEAGQSLQGVSRARLINAMLANVYRNGVPAGAGARVADKVGFMNGLLHDAAIVYSPKGTYVIAVMTDGSSWAEIAGLTRELEKIR